MTKQDESVVQQIDRLVQENESLHTKVKKLEGQLSAAREILKPQWKEHMKLVAVFGKSSIGIETTSTPEADPLLRFRPVLESANRESYRKVVQVIADMGGHATVKQIVAATGYSVTTVENAIHWLKKHEIIHKDGNKAVIER